MEKMFKLIKEHKILTIVLGILVPLVPVLLIHILYKINIPWEFFVAKWSAGELLQFYGAYLSFIGTVVLGALALWQNHQLAKMNEEHEKFKEEQERKMKIPRFKIPYKSWGSNGRFYKWHIDFQNISANIATNIVVSDFRTYDKDGKIVCKQDECVIKDNTLQGGESTTIEFNNEQFNTENLKDNFKVYFEISCIDEYNENHKWIVKTEIINQECTRKFDFISLE